MVNLAGYYHHRIRELASLLASLVGSYRMLVDSADQFNRIALAHRDDVKEAVDRAEELGDIVDEVLAELKVRLREYLRLDPQMSGHLYGENNYEETHEE